MTSSTEKRSKRKKSKIYKVINRACRINIIKAVKKILGDGSHPPVSRAKNEIKQGEIDKKETLMVTPYGVFARYEQEELLDQYHAEGSNQQEEMAYAKEEPANKETQATEGKETSAFEVLGWIAGGIAKTILFPFILCSRGAGFIWSKTPKLIKGGLINFEKNISASLVHLIDRADEKIGMVEGKIIKVEAKASERIAALIAFFNHIQLKIHRFREKIKENYHQAQVYTTNHKKGLMITSAGALAFVVAGTLFIGSITGYEYSYNGKALGLVKNQNDVYITVDVIGDKLDKEYNAKIIIDKEKNISLKRVIGLGLDLDSREEVLNKFTYLKDMEVQAYAIAVDGKQVALLDSKESAEQILTTIQNTYLKKSDRIVYDQVGFAENVVIKEAATKLGNLQDQDEILEYMLTGAIEKKKHIVKKGETFSEIASMYQITQKQLKASNPDTIPEKLHIGQELVLTAAAPVLTVQTIETAEYDQSIPYTITYENTEARYKGEQSVKSKGIDGKRKVVAKIVRNNGIEVQRTELSSVVAFEPVAQVVLVGTKKLPPLVGTGTFINPTRGVITSRFGTRWGRLHEGIDIGVPTGTSVRAADGGTVIFSGRDGGYGYVLRINHGGNRVTVYAHCSKLLVKKGEKVFQGQQIALSGNTGSSTGPHLHFEIRINGRPVNPSKYL